MITNIHIKINTEEEAIVGAGGWYGYDADQSVRKLAEIVTNSVRDAYPDACVTVSPEFCPFQETISITTDEDEDTEQDEDDIGGLVSEAWQDWDSWAVPADDE